MEWFDHMYLVAVFLVMTFVRLILGLRASLHF